jgi:hypothetical protein
LIKLGFGDGAIVYPMVSEECKASDVAKADGGVAEGADVDWWSGGKSELVLESFVAIDVGGEDGLVFFVLLVDFGDQAVLVALVGWTAGC